MEKKIWVTPFDLKMKLMKHFFAAPSAPPKLPTTILMIASSFFQKNSRAPVFPARKITVFVKFVRQKAVS
jgi:hypothetical protein